MNSVHPYLDYAFGDSLRKESIARLLFFVGVLQGTYLLSRFLFNKYIPKYSSLDETRKIKVCCYVSSTVHIVSILPPIFYLINNSNELWDDQVNASNETANTIFAFSAAYFLWDLYICLIQKKIQYQFLLHHFACFIAYNIVQSPLLQIHSLHILLFEFSTIFLNIRHWLIFFELKDEYPKVYALVEKSFGISFIIIRLFFGIPWSVRCFLVGFEAIQNGIEMNIFGFWYLALANVAVTTLNFKWGYDLFKIALGLKKPISNKKSA
eukprot:snap_masked-scaffold_13-processed-gene-6.44-mRNA-1 protein AED:1.00 eAED:1.00 QI:0/-1/0/0/-1/1/1/0/265